MFALLTKERPASSRAYIIAELKRRNLVGVAHEKHLAKRQKIANGHADVDEVANESAVDDDVLDSLLDIQAC